MNLFHILFVIYFLQVIMHFILVYKIMKLEKIISGFADFMMKANRSYPLMFQILLGKNNLLVIKLFRVNLIIALIVFILLMLTIIIPV